MKIEATKENVISLLENGFNLTAVLNREHFCNSLCQRLVSAGFQVEREVRDVQLADGCMGKFNYVITDAEGSKCVMELDNRSPRGRSLMKINALPANVDGFILLRNGRTLERYKTLDVDVVCAVKG